MLNLLIIVFAITIVYVTVAERVKIHIRLLAAQGAILTAVALQELHEISIANLAFILAETLIFKALIIPTYLNRIAVRNKLGKVADSAMPIYASLLIVSGVIVLCYIFAFSLHDQHLEIKYFTVSMAAMFAGLWMILIHRDIISHLIGYLVIENGIFLLALALGSEMPMIVNMCILLDILVSVVVLGVFVNRIGNQFAVFKVNTLSELKD